jgi:hypothetical protein
MRCVSHEAILQPGAGPNEDGIHNRAAYRQPTYLAQHGNSSNDPAVALDVIRATAAVRCSENALQIAT